MRVLLVHNRYQNPGGEDLVFEAEQALLREAGHEVLVHERHNDEIAGYTPLQRLALAGSTIWGRQSRRRLLSLLRRERPQLAHFHNTFPLISPAAYLACRDAGVPVVQTLHNFRLLCPNALLHRDGRPCEDCLGRTVPWPGVQHGCYRGSRGQSAVVALMLASHRLLGTWRGAVDAYVALSENARRAFVRGGLPAGRIHVKPNFLARDPGPAGAAGRGALFAGRLVPEKGAELLLSAWRQLAGHPLTLLGDGPQRPLVQRLAGELDGVRHGGQVTPQQVLQAMREAAFVVIPSTWYEGFPMVLLQAYACGRPVLAARIGALPELVREGETGLLFEPGDAADLADKARHLLTSGRDAELMGRVARRVFEARYSARANLQRLLQIYRAAGAQLQ
jgi:glycosyltransferase involved in cell wall biosynthesis